MARSVVLYEGDSVVERMAWGRQSVLVTEEASFNAEICPRAVRLLIVMPPRFVSCFFTQVMPDAARQKPQRDNADYWAEVAAILASIPDNLEVTSNAFNAMKGMILQLSPAAVEHMRGREAAVFAQSFLNMPEKYVFVPEVKRDIKPEAMDLLDSMYAYFDKNPNVARLALEALLLALASWELDDRLGLTRDSLCLPVYLARHDLDERVEVDGAGRVTTPPFFLADGLLMIGA